MVSAVFTVQCPVGCQMNVGGAEHSLAASDYGHTILRCVLKHLVLSGFTIILTVFGRKNLQLNASVFNVCHF